MRMRAWAGAVTLILVSASLLTGCGGVGEVAIQDCLPRPLRLTPASAAPGDTITVASGPADCDLGYHDGTTYTMRIVLPHHQSPDTIVPVGVDGRFTARLTIPPEFPTGDAWVTVDGSPFDRCGDSSAGSCVGYTARLTIR
ncbi:hypothetical protein KNO15_01500 [Leifsonia shinshuensis]|uniref:hypothetical protein n=1 Tax=Leifsonia shinshuensis TaxID=150026 RepID=UPI001F50F732|nr:hypothetical protein [Leifsonia shinshuensis]MCI0155371.1 hypothetical protein [Leifsonia shinshuensis]